MLFRKRFFPQAQEQQIIAAIREAEKQTSGEIRVHLSDTVKTSVLDDAAYYFTHLNMHKTRYRNGVLIYIATRSRQFAIIGDEGINAKVPDHFWDNVKDIMQSHFKKGEMSEGISKAIQLAGEQLRLYFPYESGDTNELTDSISYDR